MAGRRLIINSPKIVNGLQTCHEIFEYVERVKPADDKRSILLRVIVPPDADTRRHIIKATNFQTAISPISLWATEKLQYDIEDRLKSIGLYYDRRKGMHRAQRRRRADIVSMRDLGKSVISIALRQPDTARARPGKLLNTNEGYKKVFPDGSDADVYVTCILIDRRVVEFLKNESGLPPDVRADLRYYIGMLVSCEMTNAVAPNRAEIAKQKERLKHKLTNGVMRDAVSEVRKIYDVLGGTVNVAKGPKLVECLKGQISERMGA